MAKNTAPPTDPKRPNIEGIQRAIKGSSTTDPLKDDLANVCDYTLELEKRLKMAETDRVAMKEINQECYNTLRSLLAGLVKGVEKRTMLYHERSCKMNYGYIPLKERPCSCAYEELDSALTAAKQHLEAAETVLEGKKGE